MPRHSKNNTNSANFTYAERQMIGSGTKRERLGRDAMKNFNACSLCLETARDPRICNEGHLYCQECILTSLLSQKRDIKRQNVLLAQMRSTEADDLALARSAARARVLKEFEQTQSGITKLGSGATAVTNSKEEGDKRGVKRKFELDRDEIERLAKEGEDEALRKTEKELAEARKAKLPNFWLPSLTPNAAAVPISEVKLQTLCQVSSPSHPVSLKSLTVVKFEQDGPTSSHDNYICPVCRKGLTNNVTTYVLKPCGDVICKTCVHTLCKKAGVCAHCNATLDSKTPFIELMREGTGFAAGGQAEGVRFDLAFQA